MWSRHITGQGHRTHNIYSDTDIMLKNLGICGGPMAFTLVDECLAVVVTVKVYRFRNSNTELKHIWRMLTVVFQ